MIVCFLGNNSIKIQSFLYLWCFIVTVLISNNTKLLNDTHHLFIIKNKSETWRWRHMNSWLGRSVHEQGGRCGAGGGGGWGQGRGGKSQLFDARVPAVRVDRVALQIRVLLQRAADPENWFSQIFWDPVMLVVLDYSIVNGMPKSWWKF